MATNKERQAAYRQRQRELGLRTLSLMVTDDEAFFLERVLQTMRKTGCTPASGRDPETGRYVHIDV